jgi:hypothetical protein
MSIPVSCEGVKTHVIMDDSIGFLRNNRLRVDTPLPLRLCLGFGTQGRPMTDEKEMRHPPGNYAARSTVTV